MRMAKHHSKGQQTLPSHWHLVTIVRQSSCCRQVFFLLCCTRLEQEQGSTRFPRERRIARPRRVPMEHREDITRFTAVDRQGDPGFFITFLDAGNALEDIKSVKRVMLAQLELCDGVSLLDVGCGTGDDVRDLAQLVGPRGRVVGVDVSGAMIAEAKKRHATSELPVEFVEGDAQDLTFPEASFDRCRPSACSCTSTTPRKRWPRWCAWCARWQGRRVRLRLGRRVRR